MEKSNLLVKMSGILFENYEKKKWGGGVNSKVGMSPTNTHTHTSQTHTCMAYANTFKYCPMYVSGTF